MIYLVSSRGTQDGIPDQWLATTRYIRFRGKELCLPDNATPHEILHTHCKNKYKWEDLTIEPFEPERVDSPIYRDLEDFLDEDKKQRNFIKQLVHAGHRNFDYY